MVMKIYIEVELSNEKLIEKFKDKLPEHLPSVRSSVVGVVVNTLAAAAGPQQLIQQVRGIWLPDLIQTVQS